MVPALPTFHGWPHIRKQLFIMGSHGCSRFCKKMIDGRQLGCFIAIFNEHHPTRFFAGMYHRMSLLLSWHPTLAVVTQMGVLKLINLDGLTVYHTNNHLQGHELDKFLRFIHTFRYRYLLCSLDFLCILRGWAAHIFMRKWWRWPYFYMKHTRARRSRI